MAIKIGSLLIRLAVEHGILQEGLARSEQDVKKTVKAIERQAQQVADFGKKLALAVAVPLAAIAKSGIDGAIAQRQAVAQVATALASMGNVAGRTTEQLVASADAMEMRSLYDGDVILSKVTTTLLTFGKIAGEQFDRAQQAALDMATVLGGDPQAAAIQLGKALNDPIRGLTALGKNGTIQKDWIDANKARMTAMIEEGRLAEVQGMILAEVERQYRSQAEAVANQDPYRTFKVILDQISETVGEALLPYLFQLRDTILANREQILIAAQSAVEFGLSMARLAQALAPLLAGYASYRLALLAASAAQTAYVAVMTTYAYAATAATGVTRGLTAALLANPFTAVAGAVGVLTAAFVGLGNAQRAARAETDNLIRSLDAAIKARGADVALKRAEADAERGRAQARLTQLEAQLARQKGVGGGFAAQALGQEITDLRWKVVELEGSVRLADRTLKDMERTSGQVVVPVAQAGEAAASAGKKVRELGGAAKASANEFQALYDRLFPYQAATRKFAEDMAAIQQSRLSDAEKEATIARLEKEAFRDRTQGLGNAKVSSWLTSNEPLVDLKGQFEEWDEALRRVADGTKVQTVRIAESFKDMVDSALSSLRRLVEGIRGGDFLSILEGAAGLFTSLGNAGVFGSGLQGQLQSIPGNANGTAYHPGGLMRVGERGPEILQVPRGGRVVPNHELREASAASIRIILEERTDIVAGRIDGRIAEAAPQIAQLGSELAMNKMARARSRSLA